MKELQYAKLLLQPTAIGVVVSHCHFVRVLKEGWSTLRSDGDIFLAALIHHHLHHVEDIQVSNQSGTLNLVAQGWHRRREMPREGAPTLGSCPCEGVILHGRCCICVSLLLRSVGYPESVTVTVTVSLCTSSVIW